MAPTWPNTFESKIFALAAAWEKRLHRVIGLKNMATNYANNLFVFHLLMLLFLMMPTTVYGLRCWHTPGSKYHKFVDLYNGKPESEPTTEECPGDRDYKYCAVLCPYRDASGVLLHGDGSMGCVETIDTCDIIKDNYNPCLKRGEPANHPMLCDTCAGDLCNKDLLNDLLQKYGGEDGGGGSGSRGMEGSMVMMVISTIVMVALLNLFTGFGDH